MISRIHWKNNTKNLPLFPKRITWGYWVCSIMSHTNHFTIPLLCTKFETKPCYHTYGMRAKTSFHSRKLHKSTIRGMSNKISSEAKFQKIPSGLKSISQQKIAKDCHIINGMYKCWLTNYLPRIQWMYMIRWNNCYPLHPNSILISDIMLLYINYVMTK